MKDYVSLSAYLILSQRGTKNTNNMRRYLSSELRRRFDIAWRILPEPVRDDLKGFIHRVRSAASLEGVQVIGKNGEVYNSHQDAGGWFVMDWSTPASPGHVFINAAFEDGPEACAVLTILHEFAHAIEHAEDDWRAGCRLEHRSEAAAWLQAAAWAARDTSGYEEAATIARMALTYADEELRQWRAQEKGLDLQLP
jgi:hypothetical protein